MTSPDNAANPPASADPLASQIVLTSPDDPASQKDWHLWAGVIALLILIAYIPAIQGEFIWDDDRHVSENSHLKTLEGLGKIWFQLGATPQYYPLTHTTYWLEYRFWGLNPTGYHVVNCLLHAGGAVLIWMILRKLAVPGAWLAAAVFALHPIQTESVAWISERKNVLSGVFFFGSILVYLKFADLRAAAVQLNAADSKPAASSNVGAGFKPALPPADGESPSTDPWTFYALSLALFACALLSKTVACSMPAVVVLLLWWKRRLNVTHVLSLIPFFVLGIAMAMLTARQERNWVGAVGPDWALSIQDRCIIAGRAIWFYAGKLLAPMNLTFTYPRWEVPLSPWQWVFPLSVLALIGVLWLSRSKIGRWPLVAFLYFVGTLVPALGFFNVFPMRYSFVADHFQYLSGVGLIALFVALGHRMFSRLAFGGANARLIQAFAVSAILLTVLGVATWSRAHVYKNLETLWRDTLARNEQSWMAHHNLGVELFVQAQQNQLDAKDFQMNGELLQAQGEPTDAKVSLNLAAQLAQAAESKLAEAAAHFERTLELRPQHEWVYLSWGNLLRHQGKIGEAMDYYKQAIKSNPDVPHPYLKLGTLLAEQGKTEEALDYYNKALGVKYAATEVKIGDEKIKSSATAHRWIGEIYARQGKHDEAITEFRKALEISPRYVDASFALAELLSLTDQKSDAYRHYLWVVFLDNEHALAWNRLGYLSAEQWLLPEAIASFKSSLQFDPNMTSSREGLKMAEQLLADIRSGKLPTTTQASSRPTTLPAATQSVVP